MNIWDNSHCSFVEQREAQFLNGDVKVSRCRRGGIWVSNKEDI